MSVNPEVTWDIRREGRAWKRAEALERFAHAPERIEMVDGKLLFDDHDRLLLLALLLENMGADAAVQLGDPAVWREAVARLL